VGFTDGKVLLFNALRNSFVNKVFTNSLTSPGGYGGRWAMLERVVAMNQEKATSATELRRVGGILQRLRDRGAKPVHERVVLRAWTRGQPLLGCGTGPGEAFPGTLRAEWPALAEELQRLGRVREEHAGADGSVRLVVELHDGKVVESVLLPREGVCVSSQVGCAVGCVFCMTGRGGLERQVGSAEIVAQVALARKLRPATSKVVFMGMGEPSHNLDNVLEAIQLLGTEGGIAHKKLVFSTVGDRRAFERMPQGVVKPALALSLHTTRAELRERLLPRAPKITPEELVELADQYGRKTSYPVQVQWTLLDGVNDGEDEVEGAVRLLKGKRAILNLIPWNTVEGVALRRPGWERAIAMTRALNGRGVMTRLRRSAGQDVEGGCGQLRARVLGVAAGPS
jgi:23S rRNA (adenine2503-C2)-methyltransferase